MKTPLRSRSTLAPLLYVLGALVALALAGSVARPAAAATLDGAISLVTPPQAALDQSSPQSRLPDTASPPGPSSAPTPRPTPPPMPRPTIGGPDFPIIGQRVLNDTGRAANGLRVQAPNVLARVTSDAPGCEEPTVERSAPAAGDTTITWPDACVDPAEIVTLQLMFNCAGCSPRGAIAVTWLLDGEPLAPPLGVQVGTPVAEPATADVVVRASTDRSRYGFGDRMTITIANEGGVRTFGGDPLCGLRWERRTVDGWEDFAGLAPHLLQGQTVCRAISIVLAPGQSREDEVEFTIDPGEYRLAYTFSALGVEGELVTYSEPFTVVAD